MHTAKKTLLFAGDLFFLYGALIATLLVRYPVEQFAQSFGAHIVPLSTIFIVWVVILFLSDAYKPQAIKTRETIFKNIATATSIAVTVSIVAFYLFSSFFELTPKTNLFLFGALFVVLDAC